MKHKGSCHCQAIQFEVEALKALDDKADVLEIINTLKFYVHQIKSG